MLAPSRAARRRSRSRTRTYVVPTRSASGEGMRCGEMMRYRRGGVRGAPGSEAERSRLDRAAAYAPGVRSRGPQHPPSSELRAPDLPRPERRLTQARNVHGSPRAFRHTTHMSSVASGTADERPGPQCPDATCINYTMSLHASNSSRTRVARLFGVYGFWRNATSAARMPCRTTESSV